MAAIPDGLQYPQFKPGEESPGKVFIDGLPMKAASKPFNLGLHQTVEAR